MSDQKRTTANYGLMVIFVCLNLIAPALVIVWVVARFGPFSHIRWIQGSTNIGLIFFIFPISITYLIVSLKRVFPGNILNAMVFFIPYLVNFTLYAIKFGFSKGFFSIWALHSLPLFLGYMFCLIAGFIWLIGTGTGNLFKNSIREILFAIPLILFFTGTFCFAWISMFLAGLNLLENQYPWSSPVTAILFFLISILLVIGFHFPLLRKLYKEGLL
jgi:hypothetical protein